MFNKSIPVPQLLTKNLEQLTWFLGLVLLSYLLGRQIVSGISTQLIFFILSILIILIGIISIRTLFFISVFLMPINYWTSIGTVNINIFDIIVLTLFALVISEKVSKRESFLIPSRINLPFFLCCIFYFMLLINTPLASREPFRIIVRDGLEPALYYIAAINLIQSHKDIPRIATLLFSSALIVGVLVLFQFSLVDDASRWISHQLKMLELGFYPPIKDFRIAHYWRDIEYRRPGAFWDWGSAIAQYLPPIILLGFYRLTSVRTKPRKVWLLGLSIFLTIPLMLSLGRTGIYAFFIAILVLFYLSGKRRLVGWLIAVAAITLLFNYFLPPYVKARLLLQSHQYTYMSRIELSRQTIELSLKNIFLGVEGEKLAPHNQFLDELQKKGIFGLIIFIWFQVVLWWEAIKFYRISKILTPQIQSFSCLFIGLLFFYLASAFATSGPYSNTMIFWLFLSIFIVIKSISIPTLEGHGIDEKKIWSAIL